MSAIAAITVNDGKATPEAHTLEPVSTTPPHWRAQESGVPVAGQINLLMQASESKSGLYKYRIVCELPVLEETSGVASSGYVAPPKVAHTIRADVTLFAASRSLESDRADLLALFRNALADSQVADAFAKLSKPY